MKTWLPYGGRNYCCSLWYVNDQFRALHLCFHIFVSSTWFKKVIFDLLGSTHLLFIFTPLQIWQGFKPLAVGVTCYIKHSFVSYSRTHSIVTYSNSHLCAASTLTKPQIYSISANRKEGKARKKEEWFMCEWLMLIDMIVCLYLICIDLTVQFNVFVWMDVSAI